MWFLKLLTDGANLILVGKEFQLLANLCANENFRRLVLQYFY